MADTERLRALLSELVELYRRHEPQWESSRPANPIQPVNGLWENGYDPVDEVDYDYDYNSHSHSHSHSASIEQNKYKGRRLIGTYDPFDKTFPRNEVEKEWGHRASEFIYESMRTRNAWGTIIESICEPFSDWDGDYIRTRDWFYALKFDVQMEVWIQRNLGLRPGSCWIIGPHDDQLPEWLIRYEGGRCRIVDVPFCGSELGYALSRPQQTIIEEN
jgi:hypothetical protein